MKPNHIFTVATRLAQRRKSRNLSEIVTTLQEHRR